MSARHHEIINMQPRDSYRFSAFAKNRINKMFKQLVNKPSCQLRQAVYLVGSLFRKEDGDKDFSFFSKIARSRFLVEPQILRSLSQDEIKSVRIMFHLDVRFRASKCLGSVSK